MLTHSKCFYCTGCAFTHTLVALTTPQGATWESEGVNHSHSNWAASGAISGSVSFSKTHFDMLSAGSGSEPGTLKSLDESDPQPPQKRVHALYLEFCSFKSSVMISPNLWLSCLICNTQTFLERRPK